MLINAPQDAPIFFLTGPRAPLGGFGPAAEEMGVVVWRQKRGFGGAELTPGKVLDQDQPFNPANGSGPFRFESEIAVFKPEPDVVIVDIAAAPPPPPLTTDAYGSITIARADGTVQLADRNFDWLPRNEAPRVGLAGTENPPPNDGSVLSEFDADLFRLPDMFSNAFMNGQPVPGAALLGEGDRIDFNPNAGTARSLTIPAPPTFSITEDGAPLDPPLVLDPRVDTVVLDLAAQDFTIVWRAIFPWEERFENATLEVTDG